MKNKMEIKQLLSLLKPYKMTLLFIVACLILSTVINLCIPLLSKTIMDQGFIGKNQTILLRWVALTFALRLLDQGIEWVKEKKRIAIQAQVRKSLWDEAFSHLLKIKAKYFTDTNNAQFINNLEVDIGNMCNICDGSTIFVITQVFNITGGIIGLFLISPPLTLLVLLFIPFKYLIVNFFAKNRKKRIEAYIDQQEHYAKWLGNAIGGICEIRLFNIQNFKKREFDERQQAVIHHQKELEIIGVQNTIADVILINALTTTLYIIGAKMVFDLSLTVGGIFAFISYSVYVTSPISAILNIGYFLSGVIPSTKRYYKFLDLEVEEDGCTDQLPASGDIEFINVHFSYDDKRTVLNNVHFTIQQSSKVAIIGHNGSGKSTLIHLLLRLWKPDHGSIKLNHQDIWNYSLEAYRNLISFVSQQIYLFNDTIRSNIVLYRDVPDERIQEAIEDAALGDFICENTLEYKVGENGAMLSGGQKQKIALARALIQDKPIIIFDEATSNTDITSQVHINHLLHTKLRNKTVLIITHKPEILQDVDQIIMLKDGEIAGLGTYQELMQQDSEFRTMSAYG